MSILDKASLIQIPSGYKNGKLYSVKPTPTYGSELVVNGDFASSSNWNGINANGVTISNGTLNYSETPNGINVTQSSVVEIGKRYKVTFTISNYVKGGILFVFGAGGTTQEVSSNGTFNLYGVASINTTLYIQARGASGTTLSIDNVSVKEITNIGDFDFSRSSSATRVNSEGLIETASVLGSEEVTNGDFSNGSTDWNLVGDFAISGGSASITSASQYSQLTNQLGVNYLLSGKKYKLEFDIPTLSISNAFAYRYTGGNVTPISTSDIVNGKFTAEFTMTTNGYFWLQTTGSFTGLNVEVDNVSVKEVIENDVPRLDYSDGSCASLLLEPQSTNLVTYSEDFSQWNAINNVIVTDNFTTSPDGTQNASKLVFDGTTIGRIELSVSASGTNTQSVYLKTESGTQNVSIGAGTADLTEFTITNQWVRYSHTGGGTYPRILCNDAATIYVYGAQFEQGSYATSYIPTSGSTVTRTADVCNNAGTSATFNSTEGVLFFEAAALADDLTNRGFALSDGTSSNACRIYYSNSSNNIRFFFNVGGAAQVIKSINLTDITDYNKIAFSYKQDDFKIYINGVKVEEDTSGSVPSANTFSKLSFDRGYGGENFYGKTKQLMVFDEALSDEELSDLTGQVNLSFNNLATFYNYTIL